MQGGFEKYPQRPVNPKEIGMQLMAPQMGAPMPSETAAVESGFLSDPRGDNSGLLAAIGGALTRVDGGMMPNTSPARMLSAPQRYAQLLQLGLSDEEARMMMQTGGA